MGNIRVHSNGFRFLFFLYHGSAATGFLLLGGCLFRLIPYDISILIGILMISIPFMMVPPELIVLLKEQKLIFRYRMNHVTVPFTDISHVEVSACSVVIKNRDNNPLLEIRKEHFKHINLFELSEYIRDLLSGDKKIDPVRFAAVQFNGCKFLGGRKSVIGKRLTS